MTPPLRVLRAPHWRRLAPAYRPYRFFTALFAPARLSNMRAREEVLETRRWYRFRRDAIALCTTLIFPSTHHYAYPEGIGSCSDIDFE